jgi:adenosine deaminase
LIPIGIFSLGGCITPNFVWKILRDQPNYVKTKSQLIKEMTFTTSEQYEFITFLNKFKILDHIKWTEDLLDQSIKEISKNINKEQLTYTYLSFSIDKYKGIGLNEHEIIKFIHNSFKTYAPQKVGLVLSLKYETPIEQQKQHAKLIEKATTADCLVGIDLVGNEANFNSKFYKPIFNNWNKAKKLTRAHVGESQGIENIIEAIKNMHVTNIAHGYKITQNKKAMDLAKDNDIYFDMTFTSNRLTGIWLPGTQHPLPEMVRYGLKVTLGSDDPVQCKTTLNKEYEIARHHGLTNTEITTIMMNSIELYRQHNAGYK